MAATVICQTTRLVRYLPWQSRWTCGPVGCRQRCLVLAILLCLCLSSWAQRPLALGQIVGGLSFLPLSTENTAKHRRVDARRFARAQTPITGRIRPEDEICLISTRRLPSTSTDPCGRPTTCHTAGNNGSGTTCGTPFDTAYAAARGTACGTACGTSSFMDAEVAIYRAGRWEMSSPEDLLQSINGDPTWENMLFIHGNRTDLNWANLRGVETYESIVTWPESCQTAQPPVGPVRWIIWAWPSDPVHGPRADLAIKRSRAVAQGPYLRQFMSSITVDSLGVVAYSLGAQALVSALCTEEERVAAAETDERRPLPKLRVVMLAGAIPVRWMQSAEADDCFRRYLDNLTLINNPRDRALKIYLQFTGLHPIGTHRCQLDTSIAAETYLLHGNQLDNHFLSHYLEHAQTRQIIRARLFAAESTNATTSPLPAKD